MPQLKRHTQVIACDACKNKPVHEVTLFRPLSKNAQKSSCSRTTYQNELKQTQGTNACNNRDSAFLDVPYRFPRKTQITLLDETPLYKVNDDNFENDSCGLVEVLAIKVVLPPPFHLRFASMEFWAQAYLIPMVLVSLFRLVFLIDYAGIGAKKT